MQKSRKPKKNIERVPTNAEIATWLKDHGIPPTPDKIGAFQACFEFAMELEEGLVPEVPTPAKVNAMFKALTTLEKGLAEFVHDDTFAELKRAVEYQDKLSKRRREGRPRYGPRYTLFELLQDEWHRTTKTPMKNWNRQGTSKGADFLVDGMALAGTDESFMTICDWHNGTIMEPTETR